MKKAIKFTTGLTLQIILIGAIGFFGTFFSDYLESIGWFGDVLTDRIRGGEPYIEWGARHNWYVCTLVIVFLVQVARLVMWSIAFWDEEFKKALN